ncbi:hypothetical protein DPEC_G00031360 [Dallia pectoralis]|uniref:Uncharacterized protein n=1 Tax=Dallia pectoralis TaxID=75939 RepID=A0ACC2HCD0_DALPE|nr:hypothetical protein DPEC_G00031360 [Dallia pectoralis]
MGEDFNEEIASGCVRCPLVLTLTALTPYGVAPAHADANALIPSCASANAPPSVRPLWFQLGVDCEQTQSWQSHSRRSTKQECPPFCADKRIKPLFSAHMSPCLTAPSSAPGLRSQTKPAHLPLNACTRNGARLPVYVFTTLNWSPVEV